MPLFGTNFYQKQTFINTGANFKSILFLSLCFMNCSCFNNANSSSMFTCCPDKFSIMYIPTAITKSVQQSCQWVSFTNSKLLQYVFYCVVCFPLLCKRNNTIYYPIMWRQHILLYSSIVNSVSLFYWLFESCYVSLELFAVCNDSPGVGLIKCYLHSVLLCHIYVQWWAHVNETTHILHRYFKKALWQYKIHDATIAW